MTCSAFPVPFIDKCTKKTENGRRCRLFVRRCVPPARTDTFVLHRMPYRRYERRRSATVFGIRPETALFSSEERNNLSEFFLTWECVPPEICTVVRLQRNVCPMKKIAYYVVPVLLCLIAGLVAGRFQAESVADEVSPAGETRADAARHRLSDRMGNHLPLHGPFAGARAPIRRQTLRHAVVPATGRQFSVERLLRTCAARWRDSSTSSCSMRW